MIDHLGVTVADMGRALAFYDAALAPLGLARVMQFPEQGEPLGVGYGDARKPYFWVGAGAAASGPVHIAFAASGREAVEAFHRAALAAGGRDNGEPGLRPHYHPAYYAAFAFDPDGNNVEAVTHHG